MTILHEMLEREKRPIESCDDLSERTLWSKHGTIIWQADRFTGSANFYPVYRYQNYYSYSLLSLILLKGSLHLSLQAEKQVSSSDFNFYSGIDSIDKDIIRIGEPLKPEFRITDAETYAKRLAEAMCEDIVPIEKDHPGFTNILMCGGKDSLNLSLLPWRNPVIVASAPPNYDLVKTFMTDNNLSYDVIPLDDNNDSLLECEILVNCCRNNLEHCRWGPHLTKLSQDFGGKVIIWKGQLGDIMATPHWKAYPYTHPPYGRIRQMTRLLGGGGGRMLRRWLEKAKITQQLAFKALWFKSAMWQGAHMSIIRQLTDALVLSGYHGPAVQKIWSQVDLNRAVQDDIRPIVGKYLHGGTVLYPSTNPSPPPSEIRKGISHLQPFLKSLRAVGISVYE